MSGTGIDPSYYYFISVCERQIDHFALKPSLVNKGRFHVIQVSSKEPYL